MTFFVSTPMGFITSGEINPEFPKQCIDQARSRDVRWAHPFASWEEANAFAAELTTSRSWPPDSRYYAIITSANPNALPEEFVHDVPAARGRLVVSCRAGVILNTKNRHPANLAP